MVRMLRSEPLGGAFMQNAGHHKSMILLGRSHQTHPCSSPIYQFCQAKRSSLHICSSKAAILSVLSGAGVQRDACCSATNRKSAFVNASVPGDNQTEPPCLIV